MAWYYWILLGIGLLAAELATPGAFVAFFFGISALVMAALTFTLDAVTSYELLPQWLEWIIFVVLAVTALFGLRRWLQERLRSRAEPPVDSLVGEIGVLVEDLPFRGVGKIEVRGTPWNARNNAERDLSRGQRCLVERVEGLTLWIRPE